MSAHPSTDPGPLPPGARVPAPDLARGGMLLLIALANVHVYLHGRPVGVRGYPDDVEGVDRAVVLLQMTLVDGRAYPLFGLLFGYGIVQTASRRAAAGLPARAVTRLVRRRGGWLVAFGLAHAVLLFAGDILGAYGLLAVLLAGLLVAGSDRALLGTAAAGLLFTALVSSATAGLAAPGDARVVLPSTAVADPGAAALTRLGEWPMSVLAQALGLFAAIALGAWAARWRLLDDPARHRPLLVGAAVTGIAAAVLGGLPLALMAAQVWADPSLTALLVAGPLHTAGGYAGGAGYAALFGLLALRDTPGPLATAVRACGQRSLSCYLAQSVAFGALLPAWTLGLGSRMELWQAALVGLGVWAAILAVAAGSARAGHRGPAEALVRGLTYGRVLSPRLRCHFTATRVSSDRDSRGA